MSKPVTQLDIEMLRWMNGIARKPVVMNTSRLPMHFLWQLAYMEGCGFVESVRVKPGFIRSRITQLGLDTLKEYEEYVPKKANPQSQT